MISCWSDWIDFQNIGIILETYWKKTSSVFRFMCNIRAQRVFTISNSRVYLIWLDRNVEIVRKKHFRQTSRARGRTMREYRSFVVLLILAMFFKISLCVGTEFYNPTYKKVVFRAANEPLIKEASRKDSTTVPEDVFLNIISSRFFNNLWFFTS